MQLSFDVSLSLWDISENREFSIPWYKVVLYTCNIFVDSIICW